MEVPVYFWVIAHPPWQGGREFQSPGTDILTRSWGLRFTVSVNRKALLSLSTDDLIASILVQQAQIEALTAQVRLLSARVAELEAKLNAPGKTPDNSHLPPSKGQKPHDSPHFSSAQILRRFAPIPYQIGEFRG